MWLLYRPPVSPVRCESIHDLPADPVGVVCIWLDGDIKDNARNLGDIRCSIAHAHLPVFVDQAFPESGAALHDGRVGSLEDALARALEWRPLCSSLQGRSETPPVALLRYLYLRPFSPLMPFRDAASPAAYRYPMVEALTSQGAAGLLASLVDDGWLQPVALLDRLRRCGSCASTHLNYVDVCPSCRSLQVAAVEYLHCFACSHVASAGQFSVGDGLTCPNCKERLRHIGVDYHRALERITCEDCGENFQEPLVTVRCLDCATGQAPESLQVHLVHSYALTAAAHAVARRGRLPEAASREEPDGLLSPARYLGFLEWMRGLSERGDGFCFSLIGLHLWRERDASGEEGQEGLLDVYESRLHEQLRSTDLIIRPHSDVFWLALPNATPGEAQFVLQRMVGQVKTGGVLQEAGLQVRGVVCGPEQFQEAETMEGQLAQLTQAIRGRVSC